MNPAPRATYRLQFTSDFRFEHGAALAPYLAALGVSHVYASPIFRARPGSTHGYDVTDPNKINPELGGEAAFRSMAATLRHHGLGLVLDVVPNHMGIGGDANAFWLDVLEWGKRSRYASWFDIDWESAYPGLAGKVLVPFLGEHYGRVLDDGGLALAYEAEAGRFAVWAHETHKLPVEPGTYGTILATVPELAGLGARFDAASGDGPESGVWAELRAALQEANGVEQAVAAFRGEPGRSDTWGRLDALIGRQHWRPAKYTLDADALNYRRFFTISKLAGVRVEEEAVFAATHRLILDLVAEGIVDGLRIDHIDGLRDPKGYCRRLRAAGIDDSWLLVEKILAPDERLPADWGADGTTGYEVANLLVGLLTDPAGTAALDAAYAEAIGGQTDPAAMVRAGKREVMAGPMAGETEAAVRALHAVAQRHRDVSDLGRGDLRTALVETIAALDVYRTYGDAEGLDADGARRLGEAMAAARSAAPGVDPSAFDFLARILGLADRSPAALDAVARVQQLSGPVMAKGLEDKVLYRYNRLIALNEVGSEPGRFHVGVDAFHAANQARLADEPRAMLATSTHDTKRGEDARMRIAALAGRAEDWRAAVGRWRGLLPESEQVDPNELHFFFQLLLGAWPLDGGGGARGELRDRVEAAMLKSVREAGVSTRWVFGDEAYEGRLRDLVGRAFEPGAFLEDFAGVAEGALARDAAHLALVQLVLKLTIPGVPDVYRGAEFWEQSLVDPDNRRPVDFAAREAVLARGALPADAEGAARKLATTAALLRLRRERPALFAEGAYVPVEVTGVEAGSVCAFERRHGADRLLVVAALRPARMPGPAMRIELPGASDARWRAVLEDRVPDFGTGGGWFDRMPAVVLVGESGTPAT